MESYAEWIATPEGQRVDAEREAKRLAHLAEKGLWRDDYDKADLELQRLEQEAREQLQHPNDKSNYKT